MEDRKTAALPILLIDILSFSLRRHALELSDLISCQEEQSTPIRNREICNLRAAGGAPE